MDACRVGYSTVVGRLAGLACVAMGAGQWRRLVPGHGQGAGPGSRPGGRGDDKGKGQGQAAGGDGKGKGQGQARAKGKGKGEGQASSSGAAQDGGQSPLGGLSGQEYLRQKGQDVKRRYREKTWGPQETEAGWRRQKEAEYYRDQASIGGGESPAARGSIPHQLEAPWPYSYAKMGA